MKILLIKPQSTIYKNDPTIPSATLPYGLAYLASYLRQLGEEVFIIDALSEGINNKEVNKDFVRYGLSEEQLKKRIRKINPEIVGITSMYSAYFLDSHKVASVVKKINPQIKVVLGGAHVSINPLLSLKDKNIDAVVKGEGEITFSEFVKAVRARKKISDIDGLAGRANNKLFNNKQRIFIKNLSALPFPAYDLLPMKIYLDSGKNSPYCMKWPQMAIISSRGCPGDCAFCSIHSVWGHRWRGRSAKNVVDEMDYLIKSYGIKEFAFLDDSVACSTERMGKICDEIISRKLNIKWSTPNGISHWNLDEKLLKKMKKSGCYRLTFGIESANKEIREFIGWKKNFSLGQAKKIIQTANKLGIWTACTFIFGFPQENRQMIDDTINFALDCDTDFAAFFLLMPFPGTRVYKVFQSQGLLDFDNMLNPIIARKQDNLSDLGVALAMRGVKTINFSQNELTDILNHAYRTFIKKRFLSINSPIRIMSKVRSFSDLKYALKISLNSFKIILNTIEHIKFTPQSINKIDH